MELRKLINLFTEQTFPVADANTPTANTPTSNVPPKQNVGTAAGYKGTAGARSIAQASGIQDPNKIKAGQTLTLPGGGTYKVQPGDTLDKIARKSPAAAPAAATAPAPPVQNKPDADAAAKQDIMKQQSSSTGDMPPPPAAPGQRPGGVAFNQDAGSSPGTPAAPSTDAITNSPFGKYAQSAGGQTVTTEPQQSAMPSTGQSSYTSPTGVALGADQPEEPGSGLSGYTSTAGAAMGRQGQSAMSSGGGVVGTKLAGDTNIGTRDYSTADMSPGAQYRQALKPGPAMEESEMSEDELSEEQLEEAFNDMLRLSGIQLNEKAVSKQQQKFMGMVHAMQKGEKVKGASPELKKAAKSMGKKDAKDFAATKHKGLPQKVNEGIHLMLDEDGHTLEHIVNRYKHEVRRFIEGDFMPENLYDALYDYYMDRGDMPYGVAKAREGDPYQWVSERFYDDVMRDLGNGMNETAQPVMDDTLNELALLAGLSESKLDECGDMGMDQRDTINVSTNMSSDGNKSVNVSAQGEKAEELLAMLKLAGMGDKHRFNTDNGVDLDHPGAIEIHGTMDADGAEKLAKQLRHASMSKEEMMDEERETQYANTPAEEYETVDRIIRQGNDLNREKKQFANMPKAGDNPMATDYMLDEELLALLDSVLVKEVDPQRPKGDTGIADIFTAGKGIAPPSPDEGPVGLSKADIPKTMKNMPLPKDTEPTIGIRPLPKDTSEPRMKNMPLPKGTEPRTKPM